LNRSRPVGFIRAVIASATWQRVLAAWSLGFALYLVRNIQNAGPATPSNFTVSGLIITNLGALLVLSAALTANEAIRRGARPWRAYLGCLLAASILTAVGQWYIRSWLHLYTAVNQPGVPEAVQRTQMIFVACDVFMFGGFAMLAFLNRQSAQRILDGVRGAELRRVQLEQQLTESRLAMTGSRIDPNLLFESLGEIRALYARSAPQADLEMDALIHRLQDTVTKNTFAGESRMSPR
jgi:hypothetical protein